MLAQPSLAVLILLALIFNFLNGFNDASSIVATIISSRAMPPRLALGIIGVAEFCGPFLFGVAVAKTIGQDIVAVDSITVITLIAALVSAIGWNLFAWYFAIPSSSSHALIGGLVGAVGISAGFGALQVAGLAKVLLALFVSPVAGLIVGYLVTQGVFYLARNASLRINWFFKNAQIVTGMGLALSHGANDSQKSMGIITLGLLVSGSISRFEVPSWTVLVCAGVIAVGAASGAWRLVRRLGAGFYKVRPVHGFCTQVASAGVVLTAALLGGPVSTTQVVSSAIMGVGSAERLKKVRWGVAGNIATAWLLTIPVTALLAALVYTLISRL